MSADTNLRAASNALGVSRYRLRKLIAEGMPIRRHREHIYLDLDVARTWLLLDDDTPLNREALPLHPSDPRFRTKLASAKLIALRMQQESGHLIEMDTALFHVADHLMKFRAALIAIPDRFTETELKSDDCHKLVSAALDDAAAELACSRDDFWPVTDLQAELPELAIPEFDPATEYAPRYPEGDPRHSHALALAIKAESELQALSKNLIARDSALADFRTLRDHLCKHLRYPSSWFAVLRAAPDPQRHLRREMDHALCRISGQPIPPDDDESEVEEIDEDDVDGIANPFDDVDGIADSVVEESGRPSTH